MDKQLVKAQLETIDKCAKVSLEEIPDLLESLCGIYKKCIDKWMARKALRENEILLSLRMMKELTALYTTYRTLRNEIQSGLKARTPQEVQQQVKSIIMSN